MNKEHTYSKICEYIGKYLDEKGWGKIGIFEGCDKDKWTGGYRIDPITKMLHRPDFAFIIQGERDTYKMCYENPLNDTPSVESWKSSDKKLEEAREHVIKNTQESEGYQEKICYATFHGKGGYPFEQERANKIFRVGRKYRVIGGSIGQSCTYLELEGIIGTWNSTLFEYDATIAPLKHDYLG